MRASWKLVIGILFLYSPCGFSKTRAHVTQSHSPSAHLKPSNSGSNSGLETAGDPVNLAAGSFWQMQQDFSDPLQEGKILLKRNYTARSALGPGDFGPNWSHDYQGSLAFGENVIEYVDHNGGPWRFQLKGKNYIAPPGMGATLTEYADHFEVKLPRSMSLTGTMEETDFYAKSGQLKKIEFANGQKIELIYGSDDNLLKKITSEGHGEISFTRNKENLVESATRMPGGATYKYKYQADRRLREVIDPTGASMTFTYIENMPGTEAQGSMASIAVNSRVVRKFTYYPNGDAYQQIEANGKIRTFTYLDNHTHTIYKEIDGKVTEYFFDENGHTIKTIFPDGSKRFDTWVDGVLKEKRIEPAGITSAPVGSEKK